MLALFLCAAAHAQERTPPQDHAVLHQTVESYLSLQASGLPGKVSITVGAIDRRLNLPACAAPQAFLPAGSKAWGRTTVGVRCTAPSPWTIYISATVRVEGEYIASAVPLSQGQRVESNDIRKLKGDLTKLPPGIISDPAQVVGRTLATSLPLGAPLRQDNLRIEQAVQQGQTVRLITSGPGFQVSSEGQALNNAGEGQIARARTPGGNVVSGVAKTGGIVEIAH